LCIGDASLKLSAGFALVFGMALPIEAVGCGG